MRDRRAERRLLRLLGVDVDELVVQRRIGEGVDAVLVDREPLGGRPLLADVRRELGCRYGISHVAPCRDDRW